MGACILAGGKPSRCFGGKVRALFRTHASMLACFPPAKTPARMLSTHQNECLHIFPHKMNTHTLSPAKMPARMLSPRQNTCLYAFSCKTCMPSPSKRMLAHLPHQNTCSHAFPPPKRLLACFPSAKNGCSHMFPTKMHAPHMFPCQNACVFDVLVRACVCWQGKHVSIHLAGEE